MFVYQQLPKNGRSCAVLSSNDVLVPAHAVRHYLNENNIDSVWLEGYAHAGFLVKETAVRQVIEEIKKRSAIKRISLDEDMM